MRSWRWALRLDRARHSSSAVPFAVWASGWQACAVLPGVGFDFPPFAGVGSGWVLLAFLHLAVPAVCTRLGHSCACIGGIQRERERAKHVDPNPTMASGSLIDAM